MRRMLLCMAAVMISCACVFSAGIWRANSLLRSALNGRRERVQAEGGMVEFSLREEMNMQQALTRVRGWLSVASPETAMLITERGTLHAERYAALNASEETKGRWAIVVHGGLGTSGTQVQDIACAFSLRGYDVLLPDLYAHGQSDGETSSLGVREAQDIVDWIAWILAQKPTAQIALIGQDEGALAILLAAAQGLPDAVRAGALDSMSTDLRSRAYGLLEETGRGDKLSGWLLEMAYRATFGVALREVQPVKAAEMSAIPLLFIHGTLDEEVPAWQSEDAASGGAQLLLIEGASHGMGRFADPETYYNGLFSWLDAQME